MHIIDNIGYVEGFTRNLSLDLLNQKASFKPKTFNNEKLNKLKILYTHSSVNRKSIEWTSPNDISNAVITISSENRLDTIDNLEFIVHFLSKCCCREIVFISNEIIPISYISEAIQLLNKYKFLNFNFILDYNTIYHCDNMGEVIMNNNLGKKLLVFNSPFDKNYENKMFFYQKPFEIEYKKKLTNFTINHEFFFEAQNHNTYFNKKFCIDVEGNIKNSLEDTRSFGNIKSISDSENLFEIIISETFQEFWNVSKDKCLVCKDCEFRYICHDNRVPKLKNKDTWFFDNECNYNPYIGKWENEHGYLSIKESNKIY